MDLPVLALPMHPVRFSRNTPYTSPPAPIGVSLVSFPLACMAGRACRLGPAPLTPLLLNWDEVNP